MNKQKLKSNLLVLSAVKDVRSLLPTVANSSGIEQNEMIDRLHALYSCLEVDSLIELLEEESDPSDNHNKEAA